MGNLQNKVVSRITLYTDEFASNHPAFIYAKQYDAKSRYIIATIKSSEGDIALSGVVQLNATKPDGTFCYITGKINDDNTATFELKSQLLSAVGTVSCDISIFASANESAGDVASITTSTFHIIVEKSNYNPDAIESSDEYSVVTEALAEGIKALEECREATQDAADEARQAAENAQNLISPVIGELNAIKDSISSIEDNYLDSKDKAELSGLIATETARATGAENELRATIAKNRETAEALVDEEVARAKAAESNLHARISSVESDFLNSAYKAELQAIVDKEKERAEKAESGLEMRMAFIESDYLNSEDKDEIQENLENVNEELSRIKSDVDTFFGSDVDAIESAKQAFKELQEYISADETGTSSMLSSIGQNASDIERLEERVRITEEELDSFVEISEAEINALFA